MRIPKADAVIIAKEKITDYLLNPDHPDGASKAVFFEAFGFSASAWETLAAALKRIGQENPVNAVASVHGRKYIVDGPLQTPSGRIVRVRTVWIIDDETETPRLVTAYPRDKVS